MNTSSAARAPRSDDRSTFQTNVRFSNEAQPGGISTYTSEPMNLPAFHPSIYAATSRRAARLNASAATEGEHEALLRERQVLLDRKFDGSASRNDLNRLEYVRWSLDRIEDAKFGDDLEALENALLAYERFQVDLGQMIAQMESRKSGTRR